MEDKMFNSSSSSTVTFLAKGLGIFWIFDALLQLQPKMFTLGLITDVLSANLSGQPNWMESIINFGIKLFSLNVVLANSGIFLIQLCIGVLLLFPITSKQCRIGLYLSVGWGLLVFIFGEGAGNLLTGSSSFYTGAPGSVLVYVLGAVILLKMKLDKITPTMLAKITGIIFIVFAALQLQSVFFQPEGITSLVQGSSGDAVGFIAQLPAYLIGIFSAHPIISNIVLIAIPVLLGLMLILKPNYFTAGLSLVFLFFVWWLGQDFGTLTTLFSGTTTDPNTAPLLMLLLTPAVFSFK